MREREADTYCMEGRERECVCVYLVCMATVKVFNAHYFLPLQWRKPKEVIEAVKYQILIMFTISATTGFGILLALRIIAWRLFDERHRLRLDRLT